MMLAFISCSLTGSETASGSERLKTPTWLLESPAACQLSLRCPALQLSVLQPAQRHLRNAATVPTLLENTLLENSPTQRVKTLVQKNGSARTPMVPNEPFGGGADRE